ncbi:MAG: hypothetical protein MJ025_00045 [Victivallaceae bacterium]|nr:hypothetical protein [Victivallaceae bacterium]
MTCFGAAARGILAAVLVFPVALSASVEVVTTRNERTDEVERLEAQLREAFKVRCPEQNFNFTVRFSATAARMHEVITIPGHTTVVVRDDPGWLYDDGAFSAVFAGALWQMLGASAYPAEGAVPPFMIRAIRSRLRAAYGPDRVIRSGPWLPYYRAMRNSGIGADYRRFLGTVPSGDPVLSGLAEEFSRVLFDAGIVLHIYETLRDELLAGDGDAFCRKFLKRLDEIARKNGVGGASELLDECGERMVWTKSNPIPSEVASVRLESIRTSVREFVPDAADAQAKREAILRALYSLARRENTAGSRLIQKISVAIATLPAEKIPEYNGFSDYERHLERRSALTEAMDSAILESSWHRAALARLLGAMDGDDGFCSTELRYMLERSQEEYDR